MCRTTVARWLIFGRRKSNPVKKNISGLAKYTAAQVVTNSIQRYILHLSSHIVPDMSGRGQPACPRLQKKYKKKLGSNNYVMYICPLYMRCSTPILFTCIAVLSCLVVKGGSMCEILIVKENNKLLGGPRQTKKIQYERELMRSSV